MPLSPLNRLVSNALNRPAIVESEVCAEFGQKQVDMESGRLIAETGSSFLSLLEI